MTIRIQVREYSKVVYALHTFSQEYQIALPEEHCSSLFRNKKFMLDEIVGISSSDFWAWSSLLRNEREKNNYHFDFHIAKIWQILKCYF